MKKQKLMFAILFAFPFAIASCGQTPTPAHEHKWGKAVWKDEHLHTYTCEECKETKDEEHHEESTPSVHVVPTCTDIGYDEYHCIECGGKLRRVEFPALEHEYDYITIQEMPTKVSYNAFETLDTTGLKVTGHCVHCGQDIELDTSRIEIEYENDDFFTCEDSFVTIKYGKLEEDIEVVVDKEPEEGQIAVNRLENKLINTPQGDKFTTTCNIIDIEGVEIVDLEDKSEQTALSHSIYKVDNQSGEEILITDASDLKEEDGFSHIVRYSAIETTNFKAVKEDIDLEVNHKPEAITIKYKTTTGAKTYNYFDSFDINKTIDHVESTCSCGHIMENIPASKLNVEVHSGSVKKDNLKLEFGNTVWIKIPGQTELVNITNQLTINKVTETIDGLTNPSTYCKTALDATTIKGHYSSDAASVNYYDNNQCTGNPIDITTKVAGDDVWVKASLENRKEFDPNSQLVKIEKLTIDHKLEWEHGEEDIYKCSKCGEEVRSFVTHLEYYYDITNEYASNEIDLSSLSSDSTINYTVSYGSTTLVDNKETLAASTIFGEDYRTTHVVGEDKTVDRVYTATETQSGVTHSITVKLHLVDAIIDNYSSNNAHSLSILTPTFKSADTALVRGYFVLGNDITCSDSSPYKGPDPTGSYRTANYGFRGTFNGLGHTIDKFYSQGWGIFGGIGDDAEIRNINFTRAGLREINTSNYARTGQYGNLLARCVFGAKFENIDVKFEYIEEPSEFISTQVTNSLLFGEYSRVEGKNKLENINVDATCVSTLGYAFTAMFNKWIGPQGDKAVNNVKIKLHDFVSPGTDGNQKRYDDPTVYPDGDGFKKFTNIDIIKAGTLDIQDCYYLSGSSLTTTYARGEQKSLLEGATFVDPISGETISDWSTVLGSLPAGTEKLVDLYKNGEKVGDFFVLKITTVINSIDEFKETFITHMTGDDNCPKYTGYYVLGKDIGNYGYPLSIGMTNRPNRASNKNFGICGTGVFDGRGYKISNILASTYGVFGFLGDGIIKNITFDDVGSANGGTGGFLAGFMNGTALENVTINFHNNSTASQQWDVKYLDVASIFYTNGHGGNGGNRCAPDRFLNVKVDATGIDLSGTKTLKRTLIGLSGFEGQAMPEAEKYFEDTQSTYDIDIKVASGKYNPECIIACYRADSGRVEYSSLNGVRIEVI